MSKVMSYRDGCNYFVMIARDYRRSDVGEREPKMYYYKNEKQAEFKFSRVSKTIAPRCGFSTYIAMGVLTNPNPIKEYTIEMLPLPKQGEKTPRFVKPKATDGTAMLGVFVEKNGKKVLLRCESTKIGVFIDHAEEEQVAVLYTFEYNQTFKPYDKALEDVKGKLKKHEISFENKQVDEVMAKLRARHMFVDVKKKSREKTQK